MLCREEMLFSLDLWVILLVLSEAVRLWALAGVVGFFLGPPQPPTCFRKRKGKRKSRKINLRQLGSSLNPGCRGAELFVGCPTGLCKSQQDPGVSPVLEPSGHRLLSLSESFSPVK